jgi:phosphonopyruvate decarboxylase
MIFVENLINTLKKNNINFFTGVPDSILKHLSSHLEIFRKNKHIIATSEGSATSLGIGYHLSTKQVPCIYMQNSGLSNAINPLISIASKEVYSIPLFLIIGWRGSPKKPDEPQHMAKGKITQKLLKLLKIKFCILRSEKDLTKIKGLMQIARKQKKVVACLIEKETLKTKKKTKHIKKGIFLRSDFIREFLNIIPSKSKIISTTGYTSRELMEIRNENKINKGKDFYMVGGMGHSSSVAAGYALNSKKIIFCLDGDGSILMHLGSLMTIGFLKNKNLKHIILNNNSHESVGGQTTNAAGINFKELALSIGYRNYFKIINKKELSKNLRKFIKTNGPSLLEVKIKNGSLKKLSRPKNLLKIKENFMKN